MNDTRRIVLVDEDGIDIDGINYNERPSRQARRAGYLVTGPVILQYPDGRQEPGCEILVTPKGLDHMSRELGLDKGRLN